MAAERPIVILHGWSDTSKTFEPLARLAPGREVSIVSLAGRVYKGFVAKKPEGRAFETDTHILEGGSPRRRPDLTIRRRSAEVDPRDAAPSRAAAGAHHGRSRVDVVDPSRGGEKC